MTGYIGGDALYAVANAYPDLEITAIVRNSDKGALVAAQYPKIRLVYGDLDSAQLLIEEASKADIVLNCADCDHLPAADALVAGLSKRQQPRYLIHTSGTGVLAYEDFEHQTYGKARDTIFNDWDGIGKVTSIPDTATHRLIDKVVLAADESSDKIKTAIVCPPCIYGPGRGPGNKRSVQIPDMARALLTRHKGFVINEGENVWNGVHVQDLSNVFLALVTSALEGDKGKATWNKEGYYFAESGEFTWGEVGRTITQIAADKKLVNTAEFDTISAEDANKLRFAGSYLWGTNSRSRAIRAKKLFGWAPQQESLHALLPSALEAEARDLGLIKGHAALAAGEGQLTV